MNADACPRFGKGVRLRVQPDGTAMLLIPEGVLELNATAAAALQLVDGARSVGEIAGTLSERFEVTAEDACSEVSALLDRLAQRRFIET